jgi:GT2 family glycosyltransferase
VDSLSTTAPQTRHTVTALIVAHDGARLLPGLVKALAAQTYPVEQTVGVDTGSRDRSGAVLAELIGQDAVFGMNRSTGYGEAVAVALRHATRRRSGTTDANLARVDWIWLLHDDCEPAPDALEKLLRAASKDRTVVVVGPKVLDGQDRRTLCEVGVSIDRAGRRVTGIDPGEIDQGQHDQKRAVLAVGSAGMLVRRDVWDRLGGFDSSLKLFRDDVDFCWRVQAAGFRVQVATDAILYHRELAARRRRPTDGGNARRLDRQNALYVLAVNLPLLAMLRIVGGCIVGSLIRAVYFLLTKQLDLSAAYALSVLGLFAHPIRLIKGRGRRAKGLAEGYTAVRLFIPPARTLSRLAEKISGLISHGPPQASYGRHQATAEESEEDEQFVDQQSVLRRVIVHPGVQLFVALLIVALVAERRLLGDNPLGGGALVPAWGGASALWREYLAGFHAVSVGSTASAPSYLAVVAGLATLLGGQAWLAVDVLLLGCVPLAGLTAYVATRWLVTATPARMLLAASYALLPVATGAVAAGRLGTAVVFMLLPLIAVSAGRMLTAAPRRARRAAWATGLLIAVAAAFAPFTWVLGLVFAVGAVAARRWLIAVDPVNAAIVVATPFFVLFPWSLHLLTSPSAFLSEAGLATRGLTTPGLSPTALLALSPGGPGVPPVWVTIGLGLALVALVLPVRRAELVIAGWAAAIAGLIAAVLVSRVNVTPPAGGQPSSGWPGVALAVAALGLLMASAPAAQWLASIIQNGGGRLAPATGDPAGGYGRSRRLLAGVALAAAATAPLLVAAYWVKDGVRGPVGGIAAPLLPAFVSASSTSGEQYRTLILRPDGAGLDYLVVRQGDPTLGEPELGVAASAGAVLSRQVAALGAPDGADAGDPGLVLGSFGIRWVLLPSPVDPVLAQRLDASLGLAALNKGPSYDLWQVTGPVARARVVAADGTTTALSSGTVNLSGVTVPASGGTLVLAEPYGGWTATLNGHALKPVATPVDGWAQGFALPPGGGQLSITRNNLARMLSLYIELLATLAIGLLALPGKRADPAEEAEALAAAREARTGERPAGPARRALQGVRSEGAGHRVAAGAVGRLRLARKRPGQPQPDNEPQEPVPAGTAAAGDPQAALVAAEAEIAGPARPEAVTAASVAGLGQASSGQHSSGQHSHGGHAREGGTGGSPVAPWDMSGDWGTPSGTGVADAWAADPPQAAKFLEGPASREDPASPESPGFWETPASRDDPFRESRASREDPASRESQGQLDDPARLPGQRSSTPESPVLGTPVPETRAPESRAPWETGPQRAPWESGPQAPVSATGAQPRHPWESGPQPSFTPTSSLPASRTDSQPTSRTGALPSSGRGAHRAEPTGAQPGPRTGAQPGPRTGAQPGPRTGAQPGSRSGASTASGTGPAPVYWTGPQPTSGRGPHSEASADAQSESRTESSSASRTDAPPASGTGPRRVSRARPEPAAGTGGQPVSRTGAPSASGTDPQRVSWARPEPAAGTGGQPVSRTGAQPASGTGPQRAPWTDAPPASGTGPQRAPWTDAPPASGTGGPTVPRTGAQPAAPTGTQPTGTQPVGMAPWESGDWGKAPDWDAITGDRDVPPAVPEPAAERGSGTGASPAAGRPAKPERHSHRAAKHGKPSRWRGSGNRSNEDGES